MLQFEEFDLKTGKILYNYNPNNDLEPGIKSVENCYLERWLKNHQIQPRGLYVATFYNGVGDRDRLRREESGKFLIVTNGKLGYFTDRATADLIAKGDPNRNIQPIYALGKRSAHNAVAYGSLVVSDGVAQTQTQLGSSILIVDDENRSIGSQPLLLRNGQQVDERELERLYDKMGDGTMLTSSKTMRDLLLDQEVKKAIESGFGQRSDLDGDSTAELTEQLLKEYNTVGRISNNLVETEIAQQIEREIDKIANNSVLQFRAATPDLPGIAKGTVASSYWCDRFGVDAIVSSNDIKGDDGRLKQPGIIKLDSYLWVNRKLKAEYGDQSVGFQVKGTIPEATLNEFNPIMAAKAVALADVAVDNWQVAANFVSREDRRRERPFISDSIESDSNELKIGENQEDQEERNNRDSLYQILKADKYGQLTQLPNISRQLQKSLRQERLDVATRGIVIPAAIAQHHSQLELWEVCNRDLPHGAIVAYYRSPFPNVGAAAIAINNLEAIKDADPEAFNKRGVVYLNPWTAKNIAITDFDGDRNAFFVGYLANDDLPQQLRDRLSALPQLSGGERYEAGRSVLAEIIVQPNLAKGTYPLAVKEFTEANAPDRKPLPISKAKKADHAWSENEPLTAAIFRAWETTANNPVGKVANQLSILQSLAAETIYIEPARKVALFNQIATAYKDIPKVAILTDKYLDNQGLPPMKLAETIDEVVAANRQIKKLPLDEQLVFAEQNLNKVNNLIKNYCDSAIAKNLQAAVDINKSSNGIDENIYAFGKKIAYKTHQLRQNVKKPNIYFPLSLPTNTQEPIGWAVETANKIYNRGFEISTGKKLQELQLNDFNNRFYGLLPKVDLDPDSQSLINQSINEYKNCIDRIKVVEQSNIDRLRENQQPTLEITSNSGKNLTIQRLCDADPKGISPVWDLKDGQIDSTILIARSQKQSREQYSAYLDAVNGKKLIGYVTPESAKDNQLDRHNLEEIEGKKRVTIDKATIEFHPPYAISDNNERLFASANQVIARFSAAIPNESRAEYGAATWQINMGFASKVFPDLITSALEQVRPIVLNRVTATALDLVDGGNVAIRFERDLKVTVIALDGSTQELGFASEKNSPLITPGTVVSARIYQPLTKEIKIFTELGEFAVNPVSSLEAKPISELKGNFSFERIGKDIKVDYIDPSGKQMALGVLGQQLVNKESKPKLSSGVNVLSGTMLRGKNSRILKIDVQELIVHQPLARIDRGELVPLPPDFVSKHPETRSGATTTKQQKSQPQEIEPLERYNPTASELRQMYSTLEASGDKVGVSEVKKLGVKLNELYPNGNRATGEFSHPDVSIDRKFMENRHGMSVATNGTKNSLEQYSVAVQYNPTAGELRKAYSIKKAAGEQTALARIVELGSALNAAYANGNLAAGEFSHPDIYIDLEEKAKLLDYPIVKPTITITPKTEIELDFDGR